MPWPSKSPQGRFTKDDSLTTFKEAEEGLLEFGFFGRRLFDIGLAG